MSSLEVAASEGARIRPLRRSEYERLVEDGAFDDEAIELLRGVLVEMTPEGAEHAWVIQELVRRLVPELAEELRLRPTAPWAAHASSGPEPDIAVIPAGDYRDEHPAEALLVIEVAGSSRAKDLGIKSQVYAVAGVPVFWVVDLVDRVVHVHTGPGADGYEAVSHTFDGTLEAARVEVRLADEVGSEG